MARGRIATDRPNGFTLEDLPSESTLNDIYVDRIDVDVQSGIFYPSRQVTVKVYLHIGEGVSYLDALRRAAAAINEQASEYEAKYPEVRKAVPGDNSPMLGGDRKARTNDR